MKSYWIVTARQAKPVFTLRSRKHSTPRVESGFFLSRAFIGIKEQKAKTTPTKRKEDLYK